MARQYAIGGPLGGGYVIDGEDRDFAIAQSYVSQPSVPTADAWNVNDKSANVTLSASDKTATLTSASTAGVRSTTTILNGTAGKYYGEMSIGSIVPTHLGILPTSTAVNGTTGAARVNPTTGDVTIFTTSVGNLGVFAAGDVLRIAWDAGAELIWFARNTDSWNASGSADPSSGTGGFDHSAAAATQHGMWLRSVISGSSATLRTELAEYTQAVPSGFVSWMGESAGGGGVTVAAVGVSAGSAVGTATVTAARNVSFEAVGVAAGSAVGTVTVIVPTSISFEAVGVAATSTIGTATATSQSNVSTLATGQSVAAVVGEASAAGKTNISTLATGQAAVSVAGDVTVVAKANVSVAAVSVSASTAVGAPGVSSSGAVSVSATSVTAATAVGDVSIVGKANVTTTGVTASALAGSPSVSGKAAVTAAGVSAAAQTGVVSVSTTQAVTVTPTGQTTTALAGSTSVAVGGGVSVTGTGATAAALAGTAAVSAVQRVTVAATGVAATALAGGVSVSGGATIAVSSGAGTIVPPVYRPHTLTSYTSRADTDMAKPAGTAENDILIAALIRVATAPGAADVVPPAGFTKIGTTTSVTDPGNNNGRLELFWKRATASEPATYTFAQWASASTQGLMVAYSGCPTSGDPIDVFSQNSASTGNTATALSVTTTQAQDNLLWLGHNWDASTTLTPPSGMTERADSLLYLSEQAITSAGATGNRTQAQASSNPWAVTLLALKGASGAAATATALTGTVSVATKQTAIVSAIGVTAPALTGGVSVATGGGVSLTPTSVTGTALTGTATATAKQVVTVATAGQAVTALAGVPSISGGVSVSATGAAAGTAVGDVSISTSSSVSVSATGVAAEAQAGTVVVTIPETTGMVGVWTGSAWADRTVKVWTGAAWVPKPITVWNGSAWV